jgi:hypothetical protein
MARWPDLPALWRCERSNEVRGQEHAPRRLQVPPLFEKALFVYPNEHLI